VIWPPGLRVRILDFEMTAGTGLAASRASSSLSPALGALADLEFRLGDWAGAYEAAGAALRSARRTGLDHEIRCGLARLAVIEAGMGRELDCRRHAGEALRLAEAAGDWPMQAIAGEALGLLELGLERLDAAVDRLETVERICRAHPEAGGRAVSWAADLADALVRRGDLAGARHLLGSVEPSVALERARAMLAPRNAFGRIFRRTLDLCAWSQEPFELGRAELCFGERLRQARRAAEARGHLEAALGLFEELGAQPWAERARTELAAA
jgi:tetratricopeptide (TPR) repeat protein